MIYARQQLLWKMARQYRALMPVILSVLLLLSLSPETQAQTQKIDSLKTIINNTADEPVKLNAILNLCEEHESLNLDTLQQYAAIALQLGKKNNLKEKEQRAVFYHTMYLYKKNQLDSALTQLNTMIAKYTVANPYNDMYVSMYVLKFNIYWRKNSFNDAIAAAQELIKKAEQSNDIAGRIKGYVCMGTARHIGSNHPDEGLKWYKQAYALMHSEPMKIKYCMVYSNIAIAYEDLEKTDSLKKYLTEGLFYARKGVNLASLARALRLYSSFMAGNGDLEEAATTIKEATAVQKRIGDVFGTVRALRGEADFYMGAHQYDKAITILSEAKTLAEKNGIEQMMVYDLYNTLAIAHDSAGNYRSSMAILRQMLNIKDSNYKANTASELAVLQTKFDLQKKETQIANQQLELLKKNIWLSVTAVLLLTIILMSVIFFRRFKKNQKLKMHTAIEDEKRLRAAVVRDAENKQRKRIAADLHDNLGVQANAIMHNAAMLQQEYADKNKVSENLQQMAREMLLNLRETLWAMKNDHITAGEVWIRLVNFNQMMTRQYKNIHISAGGDAPVFTLPSPQALNIVMIVQEAVSNAIQHAQATAIQTHSSFNTHKWTITVTDNGTGFDYEQAKLKDAHYGLIHLNERAAAGNIDLNVSSSAGNGTVITLLIPLK